MFVNSSINRSQLLPVCRSIKIWWVLVECISTNWMANLRI